MGTPLKSMLTGLAGDKKVPMLHLGWTLALTNWQAMAERLRRAGTRYDLEPQSRLVGQPGKPRVKFLLDPFDNPIEVKGLARPDAIYAT